MIFSRLCLENFGVFQGKTEVVFESEEGNRERNVILVGGLNGRGKTTLLESILLALYGRFSPAFKRSELGYGEYLRRYTNRSGRNTKAAVQLCFSVTMGREIMDICVRRSWDCAAARVFEDVKVWVDGVLDSHLSQNWYLFIEEILPAGVARLFFFDGEQVSAIADDLGGEYTKVAINSLLGIDVIDRLVRDLKRIVDRTTKSLTSTDLLKEIAEIEGQRDRLLGDLTEKKAQVQAVVERIDVLRRELAEAEELFLKQGGKLEEGRDELKKHLGEVSSRLSEAKAELRNLVAGCLPLNLVRSLLKKAREQVAKETEARLARHFNDYLHYMSVKIVDGLSGVDGPVLRKMHMIFESEQERLAPLMEIKPTFNLSPIGIYQLDSFLERSLETELQMIKRRVNEVTELEEERKTLERLLSLEPDPDELDSRLADVKRISHELSMAENELDVLNCEIEGLGRELAVIESNAMRLIDRILQQENDEEDAKRVTQYAMIAIDTINEYKTKLTVNKLKELELSILECFTSLIHKRSLISGIRIDPETYAVSLFDSAGDEIMGSQLSTGERQMLAISILWGMGKASKRKMPVVIDTPLARLDSSHRYNCVKRYLPHASHQVIVLSTDEEIVGEYLGMLKTNILSKFLLVYDEERRATTIIQGYFSGDSDDR
ncbi:MAG: DNA sulfur modification protein DndD [Firmicutes bacterium]|jgi:DNA sulfur modification protein DndD|nr:DNA sulfur modification protein DndD [Bacillota bacterium]